MATMFPRTFPLDSGNEDVTGERQVYEALSHLPSDTMVLYQPRIPTSSGFALEPDFIVVIPEIGLLVLEVKNWREIVSADPHKVTIRSAAGTLHEMKNPLKQANEYAHILRDFLRQRVIGRTETGSERLAFPVTSAVVWLGRRAGTKYELSCDLGMVEPGRIISRDQLESPAVLEEALREVPVPFKGTIPISDAQALTHALGFNQARLVQFEKHCQKLCKLHEGLAEVAKELDDNSSEAKLTESVDLLARQSFAVAFLGSFSSGKTTLINALVPGLELPTRVLPTTSVTTVVCRGPESKGELIYRSIEEIKQINDLVPESQRLDPEFPDAGKQLFETDLATVFTWVAANPNAAHVKHVTITLPDAAIPSGLHLVDLPGTDSTLATHRLAAEVFIPMADVVVFVINAKQALGDKDHEILMALERERKVSGPERMLFVLNHFDEVSDREQILIRVRQGLAEWGFTAPIVVTTSARLGELAARPTLDEDEKKAARRSLRRLASSEAPREAWSEIAGINEIRRTLEDILVLRRGPIMLANGIGRLHVVHEIMKSRLSAGLRDTTDQSQEGELRALRDSRKRLEQEALPEARVRQERAIEDVERAIEHELSTVDQLQGELVPLVGPVPAEIARDVDERLQQVQRLWVEGRVAGVQRAFDEFIRKRRWWMNELGRAVEQELDSQPDADGTAPMAVNTSDITAGLRHSRDYSNERGIVAAVATGAIMGAVSGTIFPGIGNFAGAVVGAVLVLLGWRPGDRIVVAQLREKAVSKHCDSVRQRLAQALKKQLHAIHQACDEELEGIASSLDKEMSDREEMLTVDINQRRKQRAQYKILKQNFDAAWNDIEEFVKESELGNWRSLTDKEVLPSSADLDAQ